MASSKDNPLEIPYYKTPPTYEEFSTNHLIPNKPCIMGPSFTNTWKANKEWTVPIHSLDAKNEQEPKYKPNYEYLRKKYGMARGQVARCDQRHRTTNMSFADFSSKWKNDDGKSSPYYLQGLNLKYAFPYDEFYTVPDLFEDDWLNEYWIQCKGGDGFRFTYFGGHATFTQLHEDEYGFYAWNTNICGIKKWTLFPPGQEERYKDKFNNWINDVRDVNRAQFTMFENAKKIVIYQKDGETVFVPANWFHQVENIGSTISITHNWINANNIMSVYESLRKEWIYCKNVKKSLKGTMSEVRFMRECQTLLLARTGWDWFNFVNMMSHVVFNRIRAPNLPKHQPDLKWQMNRIEDVLKQWESDEPHLLEYFKHDYFFRTYTMLKSDINTLKKR